MYIYTSISACNYCQPIQLVFNLPFTFDIWCLLYVFFSNLNFFSFFYVVYVCCAHYRMMQQGAQKHHLSDLSFQMGYLGKVK